MKTITITAPLLDLIWVATALLAMFFCLGLFIGEERGKKAAAKAQYNDFINPSKNDKS